MSHRHAITLMRHGPPDVSRETRVALRDMDGWIADYNAAGVSADAPVSATAAARGAGQVFASQVFASPLPRAIDSVSKLRLTAGVIDPAFTELSLPAAPDLGFVAPASRWLVALRLAWLAGRTRGCESFDAARRRTAEAAMRLEDAATAGPVLLMAHGGTNRMIAAALRHRGWRIAGTSPAGFWSYAVLYPPGRKNAA